jgi:hypothetical protein
MTFYAGCGSVCLPFFLLLFRLPQSFCIREQAQKDCSPIRISLFREQLVKVFDVTLSDEFVDHGLHSIEAPHRRM